MVRVFLYTSLFLFLTCVSYGNSIQINDENSDEYLYNDNDNADSDLLDSQLSELDLNAQNRENSYKKVLTFVKKLQDSIDKEHTDLTHIFSAETNEHNNRRKELEEARLSVIKLQSSLQKTQWKIGNLTNNLNFTGNERTRVLDTIEYHNNLLKEELSTVNKFYVESDKYKNYKEFPEIKKQIDELKHSVHNETTDVINIYSNLANKISNDLLSKRKKLQLFRDQERELNITLNSQGNNFNNLFNSFQTFVNNYQRNTKQYKDATESYIEERQLLQKLSEFLENNNPQKCMKIQQNYEELIKSHNIKNKANEQLLNEMNELKKQKESLNKQLLDATSKLNIYKSNVRENVKQNDITSSINRKNEASSKSQVNQITNSKVTDSKVTNGKVTNGKVTNGKVTNGKVTNTNSKVTGKSVLKN